MSESPSARGDTSAPESRATSVAPVPPPKLKIKLRLGAGATTTLTSGSGIASASTSAAATPNKRGTRKSLKRKRTPSEDELGSENEESEGDYFNSGAEDDEDGEQRPQRLTARQAALAKKGDENEEAPPSEHVSLPLDNISKRGKKATLTESELALRREESARKRRNLTEKKLEDEKQDTINRLLRKQGRRGAAVKEEEEEDEEEGEEVEVEMAEAEVYEPGPPMFRWISNAKGITFSVPEAWLPASKMESPNSVAA